MRPPGPAVGTQPQIGTQVPPEARVQVQPVIVPGSVEARPLGGDSRAVAGRRAGAEPPRASGDLKTGPQAVKLPYSEENLAMLLRQAPPQPAAGPAAPQPGGEDGRGTGG